MHIFIQSKKYLFCKNFVIQRKYLRSFYIQTGFFSYENIYYSIKKNVLNEIFLFNDFR